MKFDRSTGDQLMAMAAHRYCLGQASSIAETCQTWLRANWGDFTPQTRNVMVRDTVEALMDRTAGMEMDVRGWWEFAEWAWSRLDDGGRAWVRSEVVYKHKPWPLAEAPTEPTTP